MLAEQARLEEQIKDLEKQLMNYPEGKLICTRNDNRYKWYVSDGHTQTYIPKKERSFAEQLAAKKYLSLLHEELKQEQLAISKYLKYHSISSKHSQKLLADNSPYQKLLAPFFTPISQELFAWMHTPYDYNRFFPEQQIHKTLSGNMVRSKSEALIDMALFTNKIPFRYECALHLGETVIYPDFTIRHPQTGSTFYWEHFGLMDDPIYCKNVCNKLQLYTAHNIIPTHQLITTYETKTKPLTSDAIERIIRNYFIE